jgi:hypothetical protein
MQQFDPSSWVSALDHAHAVADLGGPTPEGRTPSADVWIGDVNPHATLGVTATFAPFEAGEIHVEASPGFPVCARCRAPQNVTVDGARTVCVSPGCGTVTHHVLPGPAVAFAPALVAVLAAGPVAQAPAKAATTGGGPTALTCPQCGVTLNAAQSSSRAIECTYCKNVAYIPARVRPRPNGEVAAPPIFFVAFRGPSAARRELEVAVRPPVAGGFGVSSLSRALRPLPGIELAPVRPGPDVRQLALWAAVVAFALGAGYGIYAVAM